MTAPFDQPAAGCNRLLRRRGWWLLAVTVIVLAFLGMWDQRLKEAPHAGYCPEHADWAVFTADLPGAWQAFQRSGPGAASGEALEPFAGEFQLAVRLLTGVRPTPARWSLWLGGQALVWGERGQWGLCVRPGVLLRGVHFLQTFPRPVDPAAGAYQFGSLYYTWRDGYLLVSPAFGMLAEAYVAFPHTFAPGEDRTALHVLWEGRHPGRASLHLGREIAVEGEVALTLNHRDRPLTVPAPLEEAELISVSASRAQDVEAFLGVAAEAMSGWTRAADAQTLALRFLDKWWPETPPVDWDAGMDSLSVALTGVETERDIPVPQLAAYFRAGAARNPEHPLLAFTRDAFTLPYAWNNTLGSLTPLLGDAVTLCLAEQPPYWLATSQLPLMTTLLAREEIEETTVESDLLLRADWAAVGGVLTKLVTKAADDGLVPGNNARDLEADVLPLIESVESWGALRISAVGEADRARFEGSIATGRMQP